MTDPITELRRLYEMARKGPWMDLPCPGWARGAHMIRNDGKAWGCFGEIAGANSNDAALIVAMHRHLPQLLDLVEAANCIRHWHDSGPNNEGMIVSAEHVRKLWEALASLYAGKGAEDGKA